MLQPDLTRDLRIFEVNWLLNGCANDSHPMSMQLDTGQRAGQ
jgi:hypothetical protein